MKRRGLGMVFQRGSTWWIQYHWRGKRYRETSGSILRMVAVKLLRKRMAEMGKGQFRGPDLEKTTFADLVQMIRDDYAVNQRRSVRRLNTSLRALERAFGYLRAYDLTIDRLNRYVSNRLAAWYSCRYSEARTDSLAQGIPSSGTGREGGLPALSSNFCTEHPYRLLRAS